MKTENDVLVDQAIAGDMQPLLDKLKTGKVAFSGPPAQNYSNPGDPPDDTLWYTVLDAYNNGELSQDQFKQAHNAMLIPK